MSRRSRFRAFGGAGLLVLAGVVCAVVIAGAVGQVLALVLIGLGLVWATSLVFYEVGLTEDRERAREEVKQEREKAKLEREEAKRARLQAPGRSARPRLDRRRGRSRRLR